MILPFVCSDYKALETVKKAGKKKRGNAVSKKIFKFAYLKKMVNIKVRL